MLKLFWPLKMDQTKVLQVGIMISLILSLILFSVIMNKIILMEEGNTFSSVESMSHTLADLMSQSTIDSDLMKKLRYIPVSEFNRFSKNITKFMEIDQNQHLFLRHIH